VTFWEPNFWSELFWASLFWEEEDEEIEPEEPPFFGGYVGSYLLHPDIPKKKKRLEEDEALLLAVL
jgi:hypothetical protein